MTTKQSVTRGRIIHNEVSCHVQKNLVLSEH